MVRLESEMKPGSKAVLSVLVQEQSFRKVAETDAAPDLIHLQVTECLSKYPSSNTTPVALESLSLTPRRERAHIDHRSPLHHGHLENTKRQAPRKGPHHALAPRKSNA